MKQIALYSILVVAVLGSGCVPVQKSVKPAPSNIPYISFVKYDRPSKVSMQVYVNCEQYGVKLGDCVKISDVKKMIARAKILDAIIDNYEKDIDAYNRLMGREGRDLKNVSEVISE